MSLDTIFLQEKLEARPMDEDFSFPHVVDTLFLGSDLSRISDDLANVFIVTSSVSGLLVEKTKEADVIGVCFTSGHQPKATVVARARELEVQLFTSTLAFDEACRRAKALAAPGLRIVA